MWRSALNRGAQDGTRVADGHALTFAEGSAAPANQTKPWIQFESGACAIQSREPLPTTQS